MAETKEAEPLLSSKENSPRNAKDGSDEQVPHTENKTAGSALTDLVATPPPTGEIQLPPFIAKGRKFMEMKQVDDDLNPDVRGAPSTAAPPVPKPQAKPADTPALASSTPGTAPKATGGSVPNAVQKKSGVPPRRGMQHMMMSPMMAQLEKRIQQQNAELEEMKRKWREEKELDRKAKLSTHIPGPLKASGRKLEDIMKHLEGLMIYENYDDEAEDDSNFIPSQLKPLDENTEVAILSHAMGAYVSLLEPAHLKNFSSRIIEDTTLWVSSLFRFPDGCAYYHEEDREGLVRVCKLVILQKYPKYSTDGYEAWSTRPPVIYLSSAAKPGLGEYLCSQLGLPQSCLCVVPCRTKSGEQHKMDMEAFERLILDDEASLKTPLLAVGYAGTPIIGRVDSLEKMGEICKKHGIWLHVEGNHLATLTLFSVPNEVHPAKSGDSMTLNLSGWLGLPSVPYVTLFKAPDPILAQMSGLTSYNTRFKLSCLPLWVCLQNMGHQGVVDRVKGAVDLAELMYNKMEKFPSLKQISNPRKPKKNKKESEPMGLADLLSRAVHALLIFDIISPSLVFRYSGFAETEPDTDLDAPPPEVAPYAVTRNPTPLRTFSTKPKAAEVVEEEEEEEEEEEDEVAVSKETEDYYDALNVWLAETLKREVPSVHLETIEVPNEGICIQFAPLETANAFGTTAADIETWLKSLSKQIAIVNATLKHRDSFQEVVEAQDNLRLVHIPTWAGLGAVQYIPDSWLDKVNQLPPQGKQEINHLNTELVKQLKSSDTAFSLGKALEDMVCVRFGLITQDTDMEELIGLVYTTAKEIEESAKFLEQMTDIVKKGIEAANHDLQKENEEKLLQEGALRQIPIVGSLFNWWSPPPKEIGVKGRTFNLASGKVASTEETYKYHMQIQEAPKDPSPSTLKKGPLKANLKPPKRRSSSQGSQSSLVENGPLGHASKGSTGSAVSTDSAVKSEEEKPSEQQETEAKPQSVEQ